MGYLLSPEKARVAPQVSGNLISPAVSRAHSVCHCCASDAAPGPSCRPDAPYGCFPDTCCGGTCWAGMAGMCWVPAKRRWCCCTEATSSVLALSSKGAGCHCSTQKAKITKPSKPTAARTSGSLLLSQRATPLRGLETLNSGGGELACQVLSRPLPLLDANIPF